MGNCVYLIIIMLFQFLDNLLVPFNFFLQTLNLSYMMTDLFFMVFLQSCQLFFSPCSEVSFLFGLLSFPEGPTGLPD